MRALLLYGHAGCLPTERERERASQLSSQALSKRMRAVYGLYVRLTFNWTCVFVRFNLFLTYGL
jgi:hypothetical protein